MRQQGLYAGEQKLGKYRKVQREQVVDANEQHRSYRHPNQLHNRLCNLFTVPLVDNRMQLK